jgi:hypothetical protein
MQISSPVHIDPVIYLAIELSASTWLVACKIPTSEKAGLHRMEAGDSQALIANSPPVSRNGEAFALTRSRLI